MQKKSIRERGFWVMIVGGMLTGMGNGSVFGATVMCFAGRGKFQDWGGWMSWAFVPSTFTGFIDWCMFVFGFAYVALLAISLKRHNALENLA
ncbi:MAG: hypothetical protein B7Z60_03075 [Ferrovum sp. 37-45-19]|jgi:hypothetical protein|uniref:hypothetical protein n=1 Tax=Ferrovum sp. JA12 TaxID=1356299 RepID=UPI0007028934|nr:hypothetical protein [Ferrovum sp. JA12]OYV80483.1 MAG: hypothetical protein B7Z65_01145 [Ferrovum sp. 21-44-67]OYV94798.1 MAG: hypothetical protein B7Z60_03075 [Ferrovum sp. 37-45-19]HQT81079.1 hypothetical protein [Ferrovaceae bacterium]HQU06104.1 hypothetical protein [Ferrovaceae bacterium]